MKSSVTWLLYTHVFLNPTGFRFLAEFLFFPVSEELHKLQTAGGKEK